MPDRNNTNRHGTDAVRDFSFGDADILNAPLRIRFSWF